MSSSVQIMERAPEIAVVGAAIVVAFNFFFAGLERVLKLVRKEKEEEAKIEEAKKTEERSSAVCPSHQGLSETLAVIKNELILIKDMLKRHEDVVTDDINNLQDRMRIAEGKIQVLEAMKREASY